MRWWICCEMVINVDVSHVYKHPVEVVMRAHLNKYPTEKEKHVIGMRMLKHTRDIKNNTLYWKRMAICINVLPYILRKTRYLHEPEIHMLEECWWNHDRHTFAVKSHNVTWSQYARLHESSLFRRHDTNPQWTSFEQTGCIDVHGVGTLGCILEIFAKQFLNQGIKRSIAIMEDILAEEKYTWEPSQVTV